MAGIFTVHSVVLAVVVITGVLISGNNVVVGQQCKGEPVLIAQCTKFVSKKDPEKMPPSPECCNAYKAADVTCICKTIPKERQDKIDMDKVVYMAKYCGRPLTPGSKCGSYTVPPGV